MNLINARLMEHIKLIKNLDNDQLDAHLLYFTISPLHSSTLHAHHQEAEF